MLILSFSSACDWLNKSWARLSELSDRHGESWPCQSHWTSYLPTICKIIKDKSHGRIKGFINQSDIRKQTIKCYWWSLYLYYGKSVRLLIVCAKYFGSVESVLDRLVSRHILQFQRYKAKQLFSRPVADPAKNAIHFKVQHFELLIDVESYERWLVGWTDLNAHSTHQLDSTESLWRVNLSYSLIAFIL